MRNNRTLFVTFYSYKGGVGRTLALANIAWEAAKQGLKVVVIDFDLEAPGLPAVEPFRAPINDHLKNKDKKGGIFEAILLARQEEKVPSLADFFATEPLSDPEFQNGGRLQIIPAGREDAAYSENLQLFNWDDFYEKRSGKLFFGKLRERIQFEFEQPDLVLIDSRTGLTDIGGICTLLLPDRVVILTGLNKQNLTGSRSIIDSINAHSKSRDSARDPDPIDIVLVATHIPENEELDLTRERLKVAAESLDCPIDTTLPYTPILSLDERVLLKDCDQQTLAPPIVQNYRQLYSKVTAPYTRQERAREEENKIYFCQVEELFKQHNHFREMKKTGFYYYLGRMLTISAEYLNEDNRLLNEAITYFSKVDPKDKYTYYALGHAYQLLGWYLCRSIKDSDQNKERAYQDMEHAYQDSITHFEKAQAISPDEPQVYYYLSRAYYNFLIRITRSGEPSLEVPITKQQQIIHYKKQLASNLQKSTQEGISSFSLSFEQYLLRDAAEKFEKELELEKKYAASLPEASKPNSELQSLISALFTSKIHFYLGYIYSRLSDIYSEDQLYFINKAIDYLNTSLELQPDNDKINPLLSESIGKRLAFQRKKPQR